MSTDELQERYDELVEILEKLTTLIDEITYYQDFTEEFKSIKVEARRELDEIEPVLQKRYDEELKAQEKEYWSSQF